MMSGEGIMIRVLAFDGHIGETVVFTNTRVIDVVKVDSVTVTGVFNRVFSDSGGKYTPDAAMDHSMGIHIGRSAIRFGARRYGVVVPDSHPVLGVLVDCVEEEMVEEPDMSVKVGVKIVVNFKSLEELLPFSGKPKEDVYPEALNAYIMDTPECWESQHVC